MLWTTPPKYGRGPHRMEITKRNNNHSFTEFSRGPVENLIKGPQKDVCPSSKLYRLSWCSICQSLSWHLMPSLDAKIMYVKYQQMNSGREFFWKQSKTTHFVPFPDWEHEVIMRKFHIWSIPDAQDPKPWAMDVWAMAAAHCSGAALLLLVRSQTGAGEKHLPVLIWYLSFTSGLNKNWKTHRECMGTFKNLPIHSGWNWPCWSQEYPPVKISPLLFVCACACLSLCLPLSPP